MTRAAKPDSASRDYQVGYGKTPVETRFKPGQSGNPKGRPKGLQSVGTLLRKALLTRVTLQENGHSRHITVQEVIIRGLVNDAAKRDHKAMRVLFASSNGIWCRRIPKIPQARSSPEIRRSSKTSRHA